jgi:hypothetical protein
MPSSSLDASRCYPHYALTGRRTTRISGSLIESPYSISSYKLYGHRGNEESDKGKEGSSGKPSTISMRSIERRGPDMW